MNRWAAVCAAAALLALPAPAAAEQVIEAQTVWRFDALDYAIDQGEPVLFRNSDPLSPGEHDVTSNDEGPDGKPLFVSETIPAGQEAPVVGAAQLKTGSYGFYCSVHPFMVATLEVTGQGTPAGPDRAPPSFRPRCARRPPALRRSRRR